MMFSKLIQNKTVTADSDLKLYNYILENCNSDEYGEAEIKGKHTLYPHMDVLVNLWIENNKDKIKVINDIRYNFNEPEDAPYKAWINYEPYFGGPLK